MKIRVIHMEGCGATPETISRIERVAKKLSVKIDLENIVVKTAEAARKFRHIGSPTVQINGLDIDPGARDIKLFSLS